MKKIQVFLIYLILSTSFVLCMDQSSLDDRIVLLEDSIKSLQDDYDNQPDESTKRELERYKASLDTLKEINRDIAKLVKEQNEVDTIVTNHEQTPLLPQVKEEKKKSAKCRGCILWFCCSKKTN